MRSNGSTTNIANLAGSSAPLKAISTYKLAGLHVPAVWK